jgi:hypothetical protein
VRYKLNVDPAVRDYFRDFPGLTRKGRFVYTQPSTTPRSCRTPSAPTPPTDSLPVPLI